MLRPSALTLLRLIPRSNLVERCTPNEAATRLLCRLDRRLKYARVAPAPTAAVAHICQAGCRTAVPRRLSIRYRQSPSAPRRATSLAVPSTCTCLPSGPVPSIDQSTTIWAISPLTNTWRALASSGRPRLRSRLSSVAISARSVTVRPSSAMSTAPSYKVSISLTLPELNRSISDGMTPSGSVGSEYDSDIAVSCSCWLSCDAAIIRAWWFGTKPVKSKRLGGDETEAWVVSAHFGGGDR